MLVRNGQKILFIGDSITDCGRRGAERPLGNGYVKQFADMLIALHPKNAITVVNKGIGGDVITGLRNRWEDDVIRNKPDWLSIKVGINDLHRTLRQGPKQCLQSFTGGRTRIFLRRTRKTMPKCRILLIDSFYISTDTAPSSFRSEVLELLPQYLRVVNDLSRKYSTLHVKTHEVFQRLLKTHEPDTFCPEPVHPNLTGHLVIANAVFDTLSSS